MASANEAGPAKIRGWQPGMPMQCSRCMLPLYNYLEDGSGKCYVCGNVTPAIWAATRPAPTEPPPSASLPNEPGGVPQPAAEQTVLRDDSYDWSPPVRRFVRPWGDRFRRIAVSFTAVSVGFLLLGVPLMLYFYPAPVIRVTDTYFTRPGGTCWLEVHMVLWNSGARAGIASITFYVDESAFANWSFYVPAHRGATETPSVYVPSCTTHNYGFSVDFVLSA